MFRRIIIAFDGSDRAQDALALALRLRHPDGILTLACTIVASPWRPSRGHQTTEEVALMLAGARARIPAGIPVRLRAPVASSPARGLTELAEQESADLVVVASSRRSAPGHIWLERTAGRLLQGAPCAVAVPPADLREVAPFRHVGIAYDGSPEARVALATSYEIAAATGAAVTILYALAPTPSLHENEREAVRARLHAQQLLDEAADLAPDAINPRTLLLHGPAARVIDGACDGIVDLLVTGSRGYGPVQRAMLGSVAEALMDNAAFPVLVIPRQSAIAEETAAADGFTGTLRSPA